MSVLSRGIQIQEKPTSMITPITSESAVQVVVGIGPVNMAQEGEDPLEPKLAYSYDEAVKKVGMSPDMMTYPLCQSIVASFEIYNVAPLILINVLDPNRHKKGITDYEIEIVGKAAIISTEGILLDTLQVSSGDNSAVYQQGTDYTAQFTEKGTVEISLIEAGGILGLEDKLTVSFDQLEPSQVTEDDVIAGISKVREIYPRFNIIPGTLLAPGWSHKPAVYSAMAAYSDTLNGCFRYMVLSDFDMDEVKSYDKCKAVKDKNNIVSAHCAALWPMVKNGERIFYQSVMFGAHMAYVDYSNDSVPYVSPSNKEYRISGICDQQGKELYVDFEQAAYLNSIGVVTAINCNGWKCWGNRTAVYPASSDVKDVFIPVRRMFNWWCNTFILTYFRKVDNPMNRKLIEDIINSERIRINGFKHNLQIADAGIEFNIEDNPETDLLSGILHFKMWLTPPTPAECIKSTIEFKVSALAESLT